jgi:GTP-binding protein Era
MQKRLSRLPMPMCIALNKLDLVRDKRELLPLMHSAASLFPQAEIFPVSAARGQQTDELLEAVQLTLPQAPPLYPHDQLSTLPMRFLAAEIIREKLFFALDKELPYTVAVRIETWSQNPGQGLVEIYATILVPKKSTKGIVIGNKGARLKSIGQQSRLEISQMLECDVYLDLWVKVRSKWTEDRHFLQELLADADPASPNLE